MRSKQATHRLPRPPPPAPPPPPPPPPPTPPHTHTLQIKCTTGTCPAGYQACADDRPHCWDLRDRLLAAVFELLQDRKSCADFLRKMGYAGWLRPCPVPLDVVVNPPILLGATG